MYSTASSSYSPYIARSCFTVCSFAVCVIGVLHGHPWDETNLSRGPSQLNFHRRILVGIRARLVELNVCVHPLVLSHWLCGAKIIPLLIHGIVGNVALRVTVVMRWTIVTTLTWQGNYIFSFNIPRNPPERPAEAL